MARTPKALQEDREERLLLAAVDAFIVAGYEQASLNRIIASAGMAKSSFYHYFRDKQALYERLVATLAARFDAQRALLDREALTRDTFWADLDRVLRGLGAAPIEQPMGRALARLFHARSSSDPGLARLRDELVDGLAAVLRHGQELGAVRVDLPAELVVELAAGWLFSLDRWAANNANGPAAAAPAERALRTLYQALAVN
jgi:AcrR family transcriptional regulator